jgi:hypothetical protein
MGRDPKRLGDRLRNSGKESQKSLYCRWSLLRGEIPEAVIAGAGPFADGLSAAYSGSWGARIRTGIAATVTPGVLPLDQSPGL